MPTTRRKKNRVARDRLREYDEREKISSKSKDEADKRGYTTKNLLNDFGRDLEYYATVDQMLREHGGDIKGKKLLHVGSSSGVYTKFLQEEGVQAVAMDVKRDATKIGKIIGNDNVAVDTLFIDRAAGLQKTLWDTYEAEPGVYRIKFTHKNIIQEKQATVKPSPQWSVPNSNLPYFRQ